MSLVIEYHKYKDKLKIKAESEKNYIWCIIRKKYLVLQPEEMIRQLVLLSFIENNMYPRNLIQVEKGLRINNLRKRFDIIIYDSKMHPFLLVECKSHNVPLHQSAIDQAAVYNTVLKAPYLLLTNGISTICVAINFVDSSYELLDELPNLT
jgi:hypothetical protein